MPNARISDLTELAVGQVAADDFLEVTDTSAVASKKVKTASLLMSGASGEMPFTPPTTSTFTLNRPATGTISDLSNGRGVRISAPGTTTDTNSLHYAMADVVHNTNNWQVVARLRRHFPLNAYAFTGLIIRAADGKSEVWGIGGYPSVGISSANYSSDTGFSSGGNHGSVYDQDWWLRITNVSTTRQVFLSKDGDGWSRVATYTPSHVITATHLGFGINPNAGNNSNIQNGQLIVDCLSWSQTAL